MDFDFDLPVTSSGKIGIAVIVDKLIGSHLVRQGEGARDCTTIP
jgi:hypothetical protein